MALLCGQSAVTAERICRAIQQKTNDVACEGFLDFTMPGHWLRDPCCWISMPIVFTSMSNQDASSLFDRPDQLASWHDQFTNLASARNVPA